MTRHATTGTPAPRPQRFIERAKRHPPLTTAVVDATGVHVSQGVPEAREAGLLDPILIGRPGRIRQLCDSLPCPPPGDRTIVTAGTGEEAAAIGVDLVEQGRAKALAKDPQYLAGATLAGIVVGARAPIMLPSRSDPPVARLVSAAIAVPMQREGDQEDD